MRRCLVRAIYLSASEVAVSTWGRYNNCSTFIFILTVQTSTAEMIKCKHITIYIIIIIIIIIIEIVERRDD